MDFMDIIYLHYKYMDPLLLERLSFETIRHFNPNFEGLISFSHIYEEIKYADGYEKPPKEEFEAKLQELIDAQPWKELRTERNKRLSQCDWVATRAFTTNTPVPGEWKAYMQALRDLPANTTDPSNPVWPVAPE
jgi:hypothetical protein